MGAIGSIVCFFPFGFIALFFALRVSYIIASYIEIDD